MGAVDLDRWNGVKNLSEAIAWHLVHWISSLWVQTQIQFSRQKFIFSFFLFHLIIYTPEMYYYVTVQVELTLYHNE